LSKAVFAAIGATGNLTTNAFWSAAGATAGHDADDHIVYNTTTGALYYDADASAASYSAVQFATLQNKAALTSAQFAVI